LDLKQSLRENGSELDILIGRAEDVLPAYCAAIVSAAGTTTTTNSGSGSGSSSDNFLYCYDEVCHEEVTSLSAVREKLLSLGTSPASASASTSIAPSAAFEVRATEFSWAGTLFGVDDLNFDPLRKLEYFTGFRKTVEGAGLVTTDNLPVRILFFLYSSHLFLFVMVSLSLSLIHLLLPACIL
jgi:hypothetical protein